MESSVYCRVVLSSEVEIHSVHEIHQRPERPGRRVVPICPHGLQSPQHLYMRPECIIAPLYF